MPDIPNPNVTIPLTIIIICGVIAWAAYRHALRQRERLEAEREERRNRNRPLEPRPQQYSAMAGSTQVLPEVHPNQATIAQSAYAPPPMYTAPGGYSTAPPYDPAPGGYNTAPPYDPAPPAYNTAPPYNNPPPPYDAPPPPGNAYSPPAGGYQLPPLAYDPPPAAPPYESSVSNYPTTGSWAPPPEDSYGNDSYENGGGYNKDISELAPALPPADDYAAASRADRHAADIPESYLPSPVELEDWNRQYAPAVEEWILNHEEALDAVTVQHIPVDSLDRTVAARKVELTSHLDYAAHAHPSRQQGAELSEMLDAADETLGAMRVSDFGRAEQNHARYLSYRDIWLPRVQRTLAP